MQKQIRICALTTISKTMDCFVVENMKNLSKNGYDITLVCNMEEGFKERNDSYAQCINLPMSRGASIKDLIVMPFKLASVFKKNKFDVVYYTSPNVSLYAGLGGILAGVKTRIYCQYGIRYISFTGAKRALFKFVEKLTCTFATHIRSASPKNMQTAIDEHLCKKEKISVVGIGGTIGVDLSKCDLIDKEEKRRELRDRYGINQNDFVFGYLGRINADKGTNELITAFCEMCKERDDISLCLVGMIDVGNRVSEKNMALVKQNEKIFFTGNVPLEEVYAHLAIFDALVHPTYREGFGMVLQEAMGMRLPIITTDVTGPSEVVEKDVSGILVRPANAEDLRAAMQRVLEDDELRESLAQSGRLRAEKYFDRPIMLENILEDLNEVMRGRT